MTGLLSRVGHALWVLGLLALTACGGLGTTPTAPTPGAAACRMASLSNPAADPSGLGGTGAPAVRGPDPGGIGGTGRVATGNGIGGTGSPAVAGQEGLGGTGIVGVVTGFASICVNGVEVEYGPGVPVERGGRASAISELTVGQLVALQARGTGDQLMASRIAVLDAAVGPLTALDSVTGRFEVMGQMATALERGDLQGLAVGDWVRVSGQRLVSGEIRATRVQRMVVGPAEVTGPYASSAPQGARVGDTPLWSGRMLQDLAEGEEIGVRGEWDAGRLRVLELRVRPTRAAVVGAQEVLLQGYVHSLQGRELRLGYESMTLGEQVRIDGGDLASLRVNQPVQVRGRVDAQQRVTVMKLEFRDEGRRGDRSAPAAAAAATSAPVADDSASGGGSDDSASGKVTGSSDDSGRGRGRGRGGREGGDSGSSGSSGSGGDSGGDSGRGRGRGRGGDSGSSGGGSSGSGSSGSGSSGSGSSGSGSSGSGSSGSGSSGSGSSGSSGSGGDSGGDSGRGRGRGRGGRG